MITAAAEEVATTAAEVAASVTAGEAAVPTGAILVMGTVVCVTLTAPLYRVGPGTT